MKLIIMPACMMRCSRVKRTNWRCSDPLSAIGVLLCRRSLRRPWSFCGRHCSLFLCGEPQLTEHLESARNPKQAVQAADDERAHEQGGHSPESVKEEGILPRVVVRGVRQVPGEAA